ncbi:MAG: type II toxin-antitoxin system VapC family toxin [Trebonia sp.]
MRALVCDTGPLLAVLNDRDKLHKACVALFDGFDGDLVVPSLIVTEVCYLAQTQVGPQAEARFLDSIVAREVTIENPSAQDWVRITQLVRQYAGFPLGVADASVIATAERLGIRQLASIDNRHMRAVTPAHCDAFELFPA